MCVDPLQRTGGGGGPKKTLILFIVTYFFLGLSQVVASAEVVKVRREIAIKIIGYQREMTGNK